MRVFAIPTFVSGTVAGLSVLFYLGVSLVFGDDRLGQLVLVQALASMITLVCIPQCWVYIMGATDDGAVRERFTIGCYYEVRGFLIGVVIIGGVLAFPYRLHSEFVQALPAMFGAMFVQACSSSFGLARARQNWMRYAAWSLLPNVLRIVLIVALYLSQGGDVAAWAGRSLAHLALLLFLAPELVRLATIHIPNFIANYRRRDAASRRTGARQIFHNWLFDVGSGVTDVSDRLVVGVLFGLKTLVVYFFARRLATLAIMVCEPFFGEMYRRISLEQRSAGGFHLSFRRVYAQGSMIAFGIFAASIVALSCMALIPPFQKVIPPAVVGSAPLFFGIFLIDCLNGANKWGRYPSQFLAMGQNLLAVRLASMSLYFVLIFLGGDLGWLFIVASFGAAWLVEAITVWVLASQADRLVAQRLPATAPGDGAVMEVGR